MKQFKQFFLEASPKEGDVEIEKLSTVTMYRKRLNGQWVFHRDDGPAVTFRSGGGKWFMNGKLHREDGPAVESPDGYVEWWVNGKLHREDGPAKEYPDGRKFWFWHGEPITEGGYLRQLVKIGKHKPTGSDWGRMI